MRLVRYAAGGIFLAGLAHPPAGFAQAQVSMVALLGKQVLQSVIFGSMKNELLGSLAGMGCKGATLAGLAAAAKADGAAVSTAPKGGPGAIDPAAMQKAMEMMQQQVAQGRISPEQVAMMQKAMAQMQSSLSQPLSREETAAVFDDLAELGLLTDSMRSEAKDCIAAQSGSSDSIGVAGATLKNVVLPSARQAKERIAEATPEEQGQLADGIVEALNSASAADRKAFLDGFGIGFFPAPVVEQVRTRVKP